MNGKPILYVDQYGSKIMAYTLRELRERCGGGRVFKIYQEGEDGKSLHVGYGVGQRWFSAYIPFRKSI